MKELSKIEDSKNYIPIVLNFNSCFLNLPKEFILLYKALWFRVINVERKNHS